MVIKLVRIILGLLLLLVALGVSIWGFRPARTTTRVVPVQGGRRINLTWSEITRSGDATRIRLTVDDPRTELLSKAQEVAAGGKISNTIAVQNILVEAHLEMDTLSSVPKGNILEALRAGKTAIFSWSLQPEEAGYYRGTIWLHLRSVPPISSATNAAAQDSQQLLSAQQVDFRAVSLLGLNGGSARALGIFAGLLSLISLFLPSIAHVIHSHSHARSFSD
jgi:hypothetical protein